MIDREELERERAYAVGVQRRLLELIAESNEISTSHDASINMILADAWDDLRMRPTAISPEEMQALAGEVGRFQARRRFADRMADRARSMLLRPFFARVDFCEEGEDAPERIYIGLNSLSDAKGELMVYDWRAPISGLYYDSLPGEASYESPSGRIGGRMTLKRQFRVEDGAIKYYVDTNLSIDDGLLLDILSNSSSRHMHGIVATIQSEQNAAIRAREDRVISVVGGAGSGKTSVAMHRAAFLMYRQRDVLDASRIEILSPGTAFSEYISTVLPELGEENIRTQTLYQLVKRVLGHKVERPVRQVNALLEENSALRRQSVAWKGGRDAMLRLKAYADQIERDGPAFEDVTYEGNVFVSAADLGRMYAGELKLLTPAQRLSRMNASLETRLEGMEKRLYVEHEQALDEKYSGRALREACQAAVQEDLRSLREQLRAQLMPTGEKLIEPMMREMRDTLAEAWRDNCRAGVTWWEDAVAEAYLMMRLGFAEPDKTIAHLLVDETQDYTETALMLLHEAYPKARVTLLGDPMQRTCPALPPCRPEHWGDCFGVPEAPVYPLTLCYRSATPIARLCNALLPGGERLLPFGREGERPIVEAYSLDRLRQLVDEFRQAGYQSIAVITRTQLQANALAEQLSNVYRLDGGSADLNYESTDNVVACYHLTKGLEFDAVIAVWPECMLTDGERRRLYTACSRALHRVALLAGEGLIRDLAIAL